LLLLLKLQETESSFAEWYASDNNSKFILYLHLANNKKNIFCLDQHFGAPTAAQFAKRKAIRGMAR
jgi:hypothetical protein